MDLKNLILSIINIVLNLIGSIYVMFCAILGTSLISMLAVLEKMDYTEYRSVSFLAASMIITVVIYTISIIISVMGSAFTLWLMSYYKRAALVLLIVSELLDLVMIILNTSASIVFLANDDSFLMGYAGYFSYYILTIVIAAYLTLVFVYQLYFIVIVFWTPPPPPQGKSIGHIN